MQRCAVQRSALSTPKPSPRGPEFVIYVFQFASFAGVFVGVGRGVRDGSGEGRASGVLFLFCLLKPKEQQPAGTQCTACF